MSFRPNLLHILVRQRQLTRYGMFRAAYENAARRLDRDLVGTAPSRAQLHRWTSGALRRLPYTDHCRVLETLFPGWTADQLFAPCPEELLSGGGTGSRRGGEPARTDGDMTRTDGDAARTGAAGPLSGVRAVFATRAEFSYAVPPHALFDGARDVRAAGLSLNLLCQQYPDQRLRRLLENGTRLRCLFLDPDGDAIKAREREEGYTDHFLTTLTKLNIEVLSRVRDRLPSEATERLSLAVYDETIRFSIVLVDGDICVMQPYLPRARGVDSPTFLLRREADGGGLYDTFALIYDELWERSRPV